MKNFCVCACAAALALCTAVPCFASSPWDGTWKMNPAKSKLTGDTFTVTAKPGGGYRFSSGSTLEYDYACDGKPYPVIADRTLTCTGDAAAGFDYVWMAGSTTMSKSHHALSSDGKMLTIKGESMRPDGTTSTYEEAYKRVSGGPGMAGKWMNVKEKMSSPDVMVLELRGGVLHMEFPAYKEVVDAKLDGSESAVTGPTVPPGVTTMWKPDGPSKLHYTDKYNGKVLHEGTETLSADGKTLTDESWEPGKVNEKETVVYEKQ
jgi:hypothetical protein